jgi:hypothetical protein
MSVTSEPVETAAPATAADHKIKVFISYARKDIAFARRITAALEARGVTARIDTRDLPKLEDWRRELVGFIREADAVVFIVSPHSVQSPVCSWEVAQVAALNKRLAPIVLERVPDDRIPEIISKINYLFFDAPDDFEAQASALADALQTDLPWVKNHTRFGERAHAWEDRGRPGSLLLRGQELEEAEKWLASRPPGGPEPTELHRIFMSESRRAATRRLRYTIAGSLLFGLFAVALAVFALFQRNNAVKVLATSDFQRGSVLLQSDEATAEGMALLARAVRRGNDQRAVTRLWLLLQQRAFWIPTSDNEQTATIAAGKEPDAVPPAVKNRFSKFTVNGTVMETKFISISGDGKTVFTAIGDGHAGDVQYRVWRVDGKPVTKWLAPEYHGMQYVYAVRGFLSFDGRYLGLEVTPWRETSILRIFNLDANQQLGGDIEASGPAPARQNVSYSLVRFLPPQPAKSGEGVHFLLTASPKGDVTVFSIDAGSVEQLARNRHADEILFAGLDADNDWLMSSSSDGTVLVSSIGQSGVAVGNVLHFGDRATSIERVGENGLSIGFDTGRRLGFSLRPPAKAALPQQLDSGAIHCKRWDDDKPVGAPGVEQLRTALGEVNRLGTRQLSVGDPARKSFTSPVFGAEIVLACLNDGSDQLSVTTKEFVTEVWAADFSQRLGLPIVERRLFRPTSTPSTTAMTAALPGAKTALIESYLWDAPNLSLTWYSLWDLEIALPLTDRAFFVGDLGEKGSVETVRMDATGRYLVFVNESDEKKAVPVTALQIDPSASVRSWIADFAEALAGVSINDAGALIPVPERISAIARGAAELEKAIGRKNGTK